MKHKQTLAMLLAAAMVLSMPLGAYAQGTAEGENPTDLVQPYVVDTEAPTISKILLSDTEVNAGETILVTVEGTDDISGISGWDVAFKGDNGEYLSSVTVHDGITKTVEIEVSEYQPSGVYHLISASVWDKAGNSRNYSANPHGDNEALPHDLSITVINDDPVTPPTQPEGNKPSRPGSSDGNNSANSSNGFGVVNYESEKPDPADKQAVKAYNFWQDAKSKIRKTAEGKTLRLSVPKEITNLPASVMETLRKENVGLRLNWNGKTITIPAGKAQPKQKLRIYWTMQTLEKLYNA